MGDTLDLLMVVSGHLCEWAYLRLHFENAYFHCLPFMTHDYQLYMYADQKHVTIIFLLGQKYKAYM